MMTRPSPKTNPHPTLTLNQVRGRRHSLDQRTKRINCLSLVCPAGLTLDTIKWDVEALRLMLQQMLIHHNVGPADLISAWDSSGDKQLGQVEFHQRGDTAWRGAFQGTTA